MLNVTSVDAADPSVRRGSIDLAQVLFLLFVALIPLMRLARVARSGATVTGADLLFIAVAISSLTTAIRSRSFRWRRFYTWLSLWSAALILSTIFAPAGPSIYRLLIGLYLVAIAVVTTVQLSTWDRFRRFVIAWLVGAAINIAASIVTVVLFYAGAREAARMVGLIAHGSLPPGDYPRVRALFVNMNMYCTYLVISAAFILMAERLGWMKKKWAMTFLVLVIFAAAFTISPGLGGFGIVFGCFYWLGSAASLFLRRTVLIAGLLFAAAFLAATFVSPVSHSAGGSIHQPRLGDIEPSSRVMTWKGSLETFFRHPVTGAGVGSPVARVRYLNASGVMEHLTDAHNTFLSVAAHTGIVGLVAFSGLIVWLLSIGPWRLSPDRQGALTALSIALCGGFLYQGLTGSFDDTRHIWILFGALAAVRECLADPIAHEALSREGV